MGKEGKGFRCWFVLILAAYVAAALLLRFTGARPLLKALYELCAPHIFDRASIPPFSRCLEYIGTSFTPIVLSLPLLVLAAAVAVLRNRWIPRSFASPEILDHHTDDVDALPDKFVNVSIALAAGIGLFAELMMIRLHASYFQLFAYFKNLSLLSCFLGLGIGYARSGLRPLVTPLVIPLLSLQVILLHFLRLTPLRMLLQNPVSEQLSLGLGQTNAVTTVFVYLFLTLVFFFNALAFLPLGQLAGRLMSRRPSLVAYGWNLLGSMAGILAFTLLAFLWVPPISGFLVTVVGIACFLFRKARPLAAAGVSALLTVLVLEAPSNPTRIDVHSPYQILTLVLSKNAPPVLETSNAYYQRALDLRDQSIASDAVLAEWADYYNLPYRFQPHPASVLVVGSGTGNDVAAALRNEAGHVDAVEIDPAILSFGKELHPEAPYSSPKVTAIETDARAQLRSTDRSYDLIVYGLLDSHVLLSGRGGIRLDSFVYTVEAFREARRRLKKDGVICLTFCIMHPELGRKLYLMLEEAFDGHPPVVFQVGYDGGYSFLCGERLREHALPALPRPIHEVTDQFATPLLKADKSTDDWPFFYMAVRTYPSSYVVLLLFLFAISLGFLRRHLPGTGRKLSLPCFLLGAGFMLLETKAVTELALVFGSTWMVVSVVIGAILLMAFLANVLVLRKGVPSPALAYGGLLLALLAGFGSTFLSADALPLWLARLVLPAVLTLPIFFSGFAFSGELARSSSVGTALSSNILGAMLGGFLEYNSTYFGFRSLYLFAFAIYFMAFLATLGNRPVPAVSARG